MVLLTLQQHLLELVQRVPEDWSLVPVKDKKPYLKRWQSKGLDRAAIAAEIRQGRANGVGVLLGPLSNGLMAVDFDGETAAKALPVGLPLEALPLTVAMTSGRPGRHQRLYRVPEQFRTAITPQKLTTRKDEDSEKAEQLELRWRGQQSVIAGYHPDTRGEYRWLEGCAPWEREIAEAPLSLIEMMLRDAPASKGKPAAAAAPSQLSPIPLELLLTREHAEQWQQGVKEGGRDDAAAAIARDLLGAVNYCDEKGIRYSGDPLQLLEDFNSRCQPPLNDQDIDRIWRSAEKDTPSPCYGIEDRIGYQLRQQQKEKPQKLHTGGGDPLAVDPHQQIRLMVEDGASETEVQRYINDQNGAGHGLRQFYETLRREQQEREHLAEAVEGVLKLDPGTPPALADVLPPAIANHCRLLQDGLRYPDQAIALTVVATVAAMLRPDVRVRARSYTQTPNLWVMLVGPSGAGKTPLLNALTIAPLKAGVLPFLQNSSDERMKAWSKAVATQKKKDRKHQQGEETFISEDLPLPPKPRRRDAITTNPSVQGIRSALAANGADTPMLLCRDELSGWFKDLAQDKTGHTDISFFLAAYDGDGYYNDVLADEGRSREVTTGKLSLIGGIQPEVHQRFWGAGVACGLNARMLYATLPRLERTLLEGDNEPLIATLADAYLAALQGRNLRDGAIYQLDEAADRHFAEFYQTSERIGLTATDDAIDALWAKAPGQALKAAAALQFLWDHCSGVEPFSPALQPRITGATMQRAIALVATGKRVGAAIHERATNPQMALIERFMTKAREWQQLQPGEFIRLREFSKAAWNSRSRPPRDELMAVVQQLQLGGVIELTPDRKGFRLCPPTLEVLHG